MSIVLNLNPETEMGLLAQAEASGTALDQYVLSLAHADRGRRQEENVSGVSRAEAVRRMIEFGEHHRLDLGESITRAFLHQEHRL